MSSKGAPASQNGGWRYGEEKMAGKEVLIKISENQCGNIDFEGLSKIGEESIEYGTFPQEQASPVHVNLFEDNIMSQIETMLDYINSM